MRLILLLIILLAPSVAFATESGDAVINLLNNVVYPILVPFVLALATILLNKIRQKWNLDISAATEAQLLGYTKSAIGYAEEKAADYLKEKNLKLSKSETLNIAITSLMQMAPKVSPAQADALVHSVLGTTSGAGATGDKAIK